MSYNSDSVDIINGSLRISAANLKSLRKRSIKEQLPEGCFLYDLMEAYDEADPKPEYFEIESLCWYGEGSGSTFLDLLIRRILPLTEGNADIVVTWERGDCFSGYRIVNGKVEKRKVVFALGDLI